MKRTSLPFRLLSILLVLLVLLLTIASPVMAQSTGDQASDLPAFGWQLLEAVLIAVLPVLAVFGVKALVETWLTFKANQPDKADELRRAATIAVHAAEQLGLAEKLTDKKDYALDYAEHWLEAKGIHLDLHLIEGAIEAAVYQEFNRDRGEAFPTPETKPPVSTETAPAPQAAVFPG